MSDIVLAGDALAVAQVDSVDVTGFDAATTYRLTIGGRIVGVAGTVDAATTETAIVTAHNASAYNEFEEITASRPGASVLLTADEAGIPFTAASSVSGGTGTIGAVTAVTACEGPNVLCANNCKNASTGARALPVNSDTFTMEHLEVDLLWLLEAISGVTLAALNIESTMTGLVGLAPYYDDGEYDQYRPLYLKVGATACTIGDGDGDGSNLVMVDFGSVQTACIVKKTGSDPAIDGLHACILKGTHASNTLRVEGDSTVDIAPFTGEVSTWATLTAVGAAQVRTSPGTTLTTVVCGGGATIDITSATGLADITTINIYDEGEVTIRGDNAIGTINVYGDQAVLNYLGSGTVTAVNLIDGATIDASDNPNAFTIATLSGSGRPTIRDPNSRMTVTNAVGVNNSNVFEWNWEVKPGRAITLGAA
jgi:hypothetical protein